MTPSEEYFSKGKKTSKVHVTQRGMIVKKTSKGA